MFSGIVRGCGVVKSIESANQSAVLTLHSPNFFSNNKTGDSIAVNGVCLTIVTNNDNQCSFDLASETLRKTSLASLKKDTIVNLEHSLKMGDSIDGHLVSGHVDGMLVLLDKKLEGLSWKFIFKFDAEFRKFIAAKGSLAIDGVSLTVGEVGEDNFSVYIIPHTYENTVFKDYKIGEVMNLEIDPISRYVVNAIEVQNTMVSQ